MTLSGDARSDNRALTVIQEREEIFHAEVFICRGRFSRHRLGVHGQNLIGVGYFANQTPTGSMAMPIN
jgi:hypothetical protein